MPIYGSGTAGGSQTSHSGTPTINDDSASGYNVGDRWVDTLNGDVYVITDSTVGAAVWEQMDTVAGAGEANTASNIGTAGVGLFDGKVGVDLQFKKINAGSSKITVTDDVANNEVDIDVAEANVNHDSLSGFVADEHIAHTGVTFTAGTGLTGGGDISANRSFAVDINGLTVDATPVGSTDYVMSYDADAGTLKKVLMDNLPTSGGGEINTASNVGTAGVGVFKQKSTYDLQFKKINAGSNKITISDDTMNDEIDIDVAPANISHTGIADIGTNTHAQIDTHIAATTAHGVSGTLVGTSDSQTLTNKTIDASLNTVSNVNLASQVTGTLPVANGGTGATTLTDGGILLGSGTGAVTAMAALAKGSLVVGDGTTDPVEVTVGTNDYVLTADSTQASGVKWAAVAGGSGEVNTASNVGTAGVGVFKQKSTYDLEFKKINAGSTKITITDDTMNDEVDIDVDQTNIDHDQLTNFVANEHINHTSVTLSAGTGLTGGGDISANRSFSLDINGLTSDATPVGSTDYVVTYDADAATHKKVLLNNLPAPTPSSASTSAEGIIEIATEAEIETGTSTSLTMVPGYFLPADKIDTGLNTWVYPQAIAPRGRFGQLQYTDTTPTLDAYGLFGGEGVEQGNASVSATHASLGGGGGLQTAATTGSDAAVYTATNNIRLSHVPIIVIAFQAVDTTSSRYFLGLTSTTYATMLGADDPSASYVGLQVSSNRSDTTFQWVEDNGTTQTLTDTGVTWDSTGYNMVLAATSSSSINAYLYSSQWSLVDSATLNTTLPSSGTNLKIFCGVRTLANAVKEIRMYKMNYASRY